MDWYSQLFSWPTVVWTGMIGLVGLTLGFLTIWDSFMPMREKLHEDRMAAKKREKWLEQL